MRFVAKADTWFDEATEAHLIGKPWGDAALFEGIKDGKRDEEVCALDEFFVSGEREAERGSLEALL